MNNYGDKYDTVIFKFNVYDPTHLVFPASDVPSAGFSSLYRITAETAEALNASGISGYRGAVWSPGLWIDCDTEEAAMETRARLTQLGLGFEVWSTGNRGMHFYIERPHAPSHLLPQIDKEWVKSSIPGADTSIYSHLHLFRNPGSRHKKTGKPKLCLERISGQPLLLKDEPVEKQQLRTKIEVPEKSIFLDNYVMSLTAPVDEGKRHETLLNCALAMNRLGEPIDFIGRWLYHVNMLYASPKPDGEIERILDFVVTNSETI
jgi:hypothetical protein